MLQPGVDNIENFKMILVLISVIFITHALVFMISSYIVCGDALLALKNFYNLSYGI